MRRSLFVRISLTLLILLMLLGAFQLLFFASFWNRFMEESEQVLNAGIAEELSAKVRPALGASVDYETLSNLLSDFSGLNSHLDVYLLDAKGEIVSFLGERKDLSQYQVNIEPIEEFLGKRAGRTFPIYGDNPRDNTRKAVFSVAPVPLGGQTGYLYVTLLGKRRMFLLDAIEARSMPFVIGGTFLVTLLLAGALGVLSFFFLTRRFKTMASTLERFEGGDYSVRVRDPSGDEIAALASTFDKMADTIVGNIEALKEKDELRRELVQNISHDLRTPLTAVLGYLETLEARAPNLTENERRELLRVVVDNVQHLKELIDELFELSKLDAKERLPDCRSFALDELLNAIALKFEPMAEEKGLILKTEIPEGALLCWADVSMISRVISNLVENALQYSRKGDWVTISATRQKQDVMVSIADSGIGIAEEDLGRIFNRFYRADEGRLVHRKGTGLGLAIVQKIVELHGSAIDVKSTLGKGSTFSFAVKLSDELC